MNINSTKIDENSPKPGKKIFKSPKIELKKSQKRVKSEENWSNTAKYWKIRENKANENLLRNALKWVKIELKYKKDPWKSSKIE